MQIIKKMKSLVNILKNPRDLYCIILHYLAPLIIDDRLFVKLMWKAKTGAPLNLDHPRTYNEKLQWLKLNSHRPEYTIMVDKVKAKDYVASIIGEEFIIPTLGVWDNPEKINFDALPDKFVIKCNHNSGKGMYICTDKKKMDVNKVRKVLKKGLKENYFIYHREYPYKEVPRRILAEQFLEPDAELKDLMDYKLFCFDGEVKMIEVDYNRFIHHNRNLYTPDWKRLDVEIEFPSEPGTEFQRPKGLEIAIEAAQKLSKGIPHVRVDFYIVNGHVYFGEMTFFHGSGVEKITPTSFNVEMGNWIHGIC